MQQCLISIIVPCYNQGVYLCDALQSVWSQEYSYWECIIVNDGSTDNTEDIAILWLEKDSRFKYLYQKNKGLCASRNAGIAMAQGVYILPLDADDKISKNYCALAMKAFNSNPNLKLVYCEAERFGDKEGKWQLPPYTFFKLLQQNLIFCSAIYKLEDWKRIKGYDKQMKYGWEDWEFWINLLKGGGEVKKINHIGFYYRVKKTSMIKNMKEDHITYSKHYVLDKHKDLYIKHYDLLVDYKTNMDLKIRSRLYVFNLFTKCFFGFKLFKS